MADFNKAFKFSMGGEGLNSYPNGDNEDLDEIVLCSNCFKDEGLRLNAEKIGILNTNICSNCGSSIGKKLNKNLIFILTRWFFVRGTIWRSKYGAAPLIQFNQDHHKNSSIEVSEGLKQDVELLEDILKIGFFYYGPRLWMIGEVYPLKKLQTEAERQEVIDRILNEYPTKILSPNNSFYRIRINPQNPGLNSEYDTPPEKLIKNGRLDSKQLPVFYASQDLEVCIHECRVSVEDEVFVAKLFPTRELKVIDLTEILDENNSEFESLDMAVHMLFLAGKHSYEISRAIANSALEKGFEGIIYPSYYSLVRTGAMPFDTFKGMTIRKLNPLKDYSKNQIIENIALFGRPIKENKVTVECINKVVLNRVIYDVSFGPAYQNSINVFNSTKKDLPNYNKRIDKLKSE